MSQTLHTSFLAIQWLQHKKIASLLLENSVNELWMFGSERSESIDCSLQARHAFHALELIQASWECISLLIVLMKNTILMFCSVADINF